MQAVVDPSGPSVVGFAPSNAVLVSDFQNFIKVDYPLEMDQETLGVTKDGDEYVFCVDPVKVQSKTAQAWTALRTERNARLAASDWTQLQDAHLSAEKKSVWADYRQALRDLPDETTNPLEAEWPLDPTVVVQAPVTGSRLSSLLDHAGESVQEVEAAASEPVVEAPVVEEVPEVPVVEVPEVQEVPGVEEVPEVPASEPAPVELAASEPVV
jgi:hypothetical protein